ncbi:lysophospholipid acyltransferase family protein [Treponema sp.]|uniref:lysophospholipid acyltransferase family protein n=1 Tax=Treponema sp. TaxID=166 RepID=UPI00298E09BA|nr:lysophospholipid acyltransferase family protein [Treponema sp.]MCR5613021.1 1-acyl-sn-glycerol-3-phosphate acyltransferase [Treponema sp.]
MKKNIDPKYIADDLPKIKNPFLYVYRMIFKTLSFILFGLGSFIIAIFILPVLRLVWHDKEVFRKKGHIFIGNVFSGIIHIFRFLRISEFEVSDIETLRNLKSCVIVANHPSLLDVVYTIALVKNTDCIIRAGLKSSPVAGIVRALYISNDGDFDNMVQDCKKCLDAGSNLIIFPEGTRTPRHGINQYKKGAARIALECGCNVQPMHIGGGDKYGLGKYEPFYKPHPTDKYFYKFTVLPQITMDKYKDLAPAIAAKRLTDDMRAAIDSVQD